jgi:hypothetical protein
MKTLSIGLHAYSNLPGSKIPRKLENPIFFYHRLDVETGSKPVWVDIFQW